MARPSPGLFQHYDQAASLLFGIQLPGGRAPAAFAKAAAPDVAKYVRDDPQGPFASAKESDDSTGYWRRWGFSPDKAEPILKADWHAMAGLGADSGVWVPRANAVTTLPRAPPRVVAFIEAFRRANADCWGSVAEALERLRHRRPGRKDGELHLTERLPDFAEVFSRAIAKEVHFAELEAQVWGGGHLVMQSHTDGATALLHLSFTLGGSRVLRLARFPEQHSPYRSKPAGRTRRPGANEISVWDDEAYEPESIWDVRQTSGNAYISSPFCFEHGVKYEGDGRDPVIVLQCRFAFMNESDAQEVNGRRDGDMRLIAEVVTRALGAAVDEGRLRLPSVEEVVMAEMELAGIASPRPCVARAARPAAACGGPGSAAWLAVPAALCILAGRALLRARSGRRRR